MKSKTAILFAFCFAAPLLAQTYGGAVGPVAIPDGTSPTSCAPGAPVSVTATVPSGYGTAASITVTVGITHTYYSDVLLTLTNPGGAFVDLLLTDCLGNPVSDSSDLNGQYTFSDAAATSINTAAVAAGASIPPGTYRAIDGSIVINDLLFACIEGNWTLTAQDWFGADVGSINHFSITLTPGATPIPTSDQYAVCQAGPGAPLVLAHAGGTPGAFFFNPIAFGAGNTPNGWFFGLDIPIQEIGNQLTFPIPGIFWGTLDANGAHTLVVPGVPAGITFGTVGLHFDTNGFPTYASMAFTYTTI